MLFIIVSLYYSVEILLNDKGAKYI